MGQIKELSCKCGYRNRLFTGAGLMSINEKMVLRTFTEEELKDFGNARKNGLVKSFIVENIKAYCPGCNKIFALPTLKYKISNIEKVIKKNCPECGTETTAALNCPKCGGHLTEEDTGLWD